MGAWRSLIGSSGLSMTSKTGYNARVSGEDRTGGSKADVIPSQRSAPRATISAKPSRATRKPFRAEFARRPLARHCHGSHIRRLDSWSASRICSRLSLGHAALWSDSNNGLPPTASRGPTACRHGRIASMWSSPATAPGLCLEASHRDRNGCFHYGSRSLNFCSCQS